MRPSSSRAFSAHGARPAPRTSPSAARASRARRAAGGPGAAPRPWRAASVPARADTSADRRPCRQRALERIHRRVAVALRGREQPGRSPCADARPPVQPRRDFHELLEVGAGALELADADERLDGVARSSSLEPEMPRARDPLGSSRRWSAAARHVAEDELEVAERRQVADGEDLVGDSNVRGRSPSSAERRACSMSPTSASKGEHVSDDHPAVLRLVGLLRDGARLGGVLERALQATRVAPRR